MYCKKCDKRYEPNVTICPICETNLKRKKTLKKIYIAIIILVIMVPTFIFITKKVQKNKELESLKVQKVNVEKINTIDYVTLGQYTFKLPKDFIYTIKDNYLSATNKYNSISYKMNIINVNYDKILENSKKFIEIVIEAGTPVISSNAASYGNREYILLATIQNGHNYLYAITELSPSVCVQLLIDTNEDNGYEIALLNVNSFLNNNIKVNYDLNINFNTSLDDFLTLNSSENSTLKDMFKME